MPSFALSAGLVQLNLERGIRIAVLPGIGHAGGGAAIFAKFTVGHLADTGADLFDVFGIGLNAHAPLGGKREGRITQISNAFFDSFGNQVLDSSVGLRQRMTFIAPSLHWAQPSLFNG